MVLGLLAADAAMWTWHWTGAPDADVRCVADPAACAGDEAVLPLRRVYAIHGPDAYQVGRPGGRIEVVGPSAGLTVGEEVSVGGRYTTTGLVASWVERHPYRPWKRRLGLLGAGLLAGVLLVSFTVRRTDAGWRVVARDG